MGKNMTNVAIVTIYGECNFGNKLQNLAVQKLLQDLGCNTTTVRYYYGQTSSAVKNAYINIQDIFSKRSNTIRKFSKRYLQYSSKVYHIKKAEQIRKYLNSFDYVVVGSDQVWNYRYMPKELLDFFLLSPVDPEKRIAIAPSVATGCIDRPEAFYRELSRFKALSCREFESVGQLKELSGKEVKCLSDPTLALSKDYWDEIIASSRVVLPSSNYIIKYVLGKIDDTVGENIVDVLDKRSKYYNIGPDDFIKLISGAQEVITDSYHATLFSIMFQKKVSLIVRDGDMRARFSSLYKLFGLNEKTTSFIVSESLYSSIQKQIESEWKIYLSQVIK